MPFCLLFIQYDFYPLIINDPPVFHQEVITQDTMYRNVTFCFNFDKGFIKRLTQEFMGEWDLVKDKNNNCFMLYLFLVTING